MGKLRILALAPLLGVAFPALQASAQGIGINLGGINIHLGGGSTGSGGGGLGVSVGGTGVSIGGSNGGGLGVSLGGTSVSVGGDGSATAAGSGDTGSGDTSNQVVEFNQQAAVDAVHSQRALPLEAILKKARIITDGQIIDARLISYRNFLLYDLKVLATTGDVSELYFYARSGEQVQTR